MRNKGEIDKANARVGPTMRVFCGRPCYTKYKQEHPEDYSKIHGNCKGCGSLLIGKKHIKFCSHTCYLDFRAKNRDTDQYGSNWQSLRPMVARRDKACLLCNAKTARMEIHHVDHDPANNVMQNMAFLCSQCHKRYHTFTEPVQRILQGFLTKLITS